MSTYTAYEPCLAQVLNLIRKIVVQMSSPLPSLNTGGAAALGGQGACHVLGIHGTVQGSILRTSDPRPTLLDKASFHHKSHSA